MAKSAVPKTTVIRTDLTPAEYRRLRKISRDSGVNITRLTGDAIREKLLPRKTKAEAT